MELRKLKITKSTLKYNRLSFREAGRDFFPEDAIGGSCQKKLGRPVTIEVCGIGEIKTDLPTYKSGSLRWFFRKRAWAKKFVEKHQLKEGDTVDFCRVGKREYSIAPSVSRFTFIDLFAGIGGIRLGLESGGGDCQYSAEINSSACAVYEKNFGHNPFQDVSNIVTSQVPDHDVLAAGFPCQPFSISGLQKGFEDTRGTLIYDIFRIATNKKPKVILLENVKHLIHHNSGNTLKTIIDGLHCLGYAAVSYKVLNAVKFGVPQNRERIIIIAHANKKFDFSKLTCTSTPKLKEILETRGSFEYMTEPYTLIKNPRHQKSGLIFAGYRNKKIRINGVRPNTEHLSRVHKQPNRIYCSQGVHPTIPSQEPSGRFWVLHEGKVRKMTILECYRIMGFPDDFIRSPSLAEQYKQIGNSVCVPMFKELAVQIQQQLLRG